MTNRKTNTFAIAVLLAWIAGFVDVTGYLVLAQVFTSHMSGNTVAAAAHFGTGEWSEIRRRAFSIPMFVLGAFSGSLLVRALRARTRSFFVPSFLLEAALLGMFIVLTGHLTAWGKMPELRSYPLVALLAAAMGLQNATLHHAREMSVRTTFITGMLVSMSEKAAGYAAKTLAHRKTAGSRINMAAYDSRRRHEGILALKYGLLWLGMLVGGICGAYLITLWGTISLCLPIAGLVGLVVLDVAHPIPDAPKD